MPVITQVVGFIVFLKRTFNDSGRGDVALMNTLHDGADAFRVSAAFAVGGQHGSPLKIEVVNQLLSTNFLFI